MILKKAAITLVRKSDDFIASFQNRADKKENAGRTVLKGWIGLPKPPREG